MEAIRFAKRYISITSKEIEPTFHAKESFYITTTNRALKKDRATLILQKAYTMGLCELIAI